MSWERPGDFIPNDEGILNTLERKRLTYKMKKASKSASKAYKNRDFGKAEKKENLAAEYRDRALRRAHSDEIAQRRILAEDHKGTRLRTEGKVVGLNRM